MNSLSEKSLSDWLDAHPQVKSLTPAICDLNGILRGKRVPRAQAKKLVSGGVKLPHSALFVDIWGRDQEASGQVFETGDCDGVLHPTGRGPLLMPGGESALVPMSMFHDDGQPYAVDPRHALARVVARFTELGYTPVCATELEFYLYEQDANGRIQPPGGAFAKSYSLAELDGYQAFLDEIYAQCEALGVPADAAISEAGAGQLEINLLHQPDPLQAADDAVLFKHLVRTVAARHGLAATFMAKPFGDAPGCGFHNHFSVLDTDGNNIFANGTEQGSDALRHAVAGLMEHLADCTLIFAPHLNSYRRLRQGTHAPVNITWGYDNRTAAIRIPSSDDAARRIEHRVAGADANPYLVLAAILGAAIVGLEQRRDPPPPLAGNVYESGADCLPNTWLAAIEMFESSQLAGNIFGEMLVHLFSTAKRQEFETFAGTVSAEEHAAYLTSV